MSRVRGLSHSREGRAAPPARTRQLATRVPCRSTWHPHRQGCLPAAALDHTCTRSCGVAGRARMGALEAAARLVPGAEGTGAAAEQHGMHDGAHLLHFDGVRVRQRPQPAHSHAHTHTHTHAQHTQHPARPSPSAGPSPNPACTRHTAGAGGSGGRAASPYYLTKSLGCRKVRHKAGSPSRPARPVCCTLPVPRPPQHAPPAVS